MRSYVERAQDFIKEVYPYINNFYDKWDVKDDIEVYNKERSRKVLVRNGIARIALITSDYVVKWDYDEYEVEAVGGCEVEVQFFEEAKQSGFDYLFAEITRFTYDGQNFYIMPRINGVGTGWGNCFDHMTAKEKDWCRSRRLTDLHSNNYGFVKGQIKIIDYADVKSILISDYDSDVSES